MRSHACHREAADRICAELLIAPLAPFGVGHDRLAADLVERDILRRMLGRTGDGDGGKAALGVARHPLQSLHAAHGAAGNAKEPLDPEMVEQHGLGLDHVAYRDDWKVEAPGAPCRRLISFGPLVPMQPPSVLLQITK